VESFACKSNMRCDLGNSFKTHVRYRYESQKYSRTSIFSQSGDSIAVYNSSVVCDSSVEVINTSVPQV
jgi:hypothetical protein